VADRIDELTFERELRSPGGPGLLRANLLFAREIAYPDLKPSRYIEVLDGWADRAAPLCGDGTLVERAVALSAFLFHEIGLRGNTQDYYDPRNSYLNDVMDRGLGLPIALSAIYIEVSGRIGLPAYGVGLPGHFIVAVGDSEEGCLLDPFDSGTVLTRDDAAALVRSVTGFGGPLAPSWLNPVEPADILARMLLNLRGAYIREQHWLKAVSTVERLRLLHPTEPDHLRDLGLLCQRAGALRRAVEYLEDYLLIIGDAPVADPVRQTLNALVRQYTRLN
jgi:regulator of sirC expression with transglutaminase-like and TPR domain